MKRIYPHNLTEKSTIWFWSLKDFVILCLSVLISVVALVNIGWLLPIAVSAGFGFLSVRYDNVTIIDYLRYAARYFITTKQLFIWQKGKDE